VSRVAAPPRRVEAAAPRAAASTGVDRLLAALPLATIYVWLCIVYAFEAWKRVTPWLFTDELELTQLTRSIAATGHAARRGEAHSPVSLYTVLTAPIWLIHDVAAAYSTLKYVDAFVMAAVLFPTYFVARMVVRKPAALFAAAGAAAVPSLAYSSYIVEETLAYPYAALCFLLIAKALVVRGRRWPAAAVAASLVAPLVRGELVVIPIVLVLALLFAAWSSPRARDWRRTWSTGDWIGVVVLVLGAIFLLSGIASHHSLEWLTVTRYYKHRIVEQGNWAAGALAIGVGVVPLVAGIASLLRGPGEEPNRRLRMYRCVALAALLGFGLYTAMKAAYLSTDFATRVEERNLIYVAPLLFVGTALVLERRRASLGILVGAGYTLYLVGYAAYHAVGSPYEMGVQLYSDALGFAILQQANRYLSVTPGIARAVLLAIVVVGSVALLAARLVRGRERLLTISAAALAVGILAWNLTGEIGAAAGTVSIGRAFAASVRHPFTWVDDATALRPTLYVGASEQDQDPEWLLEFWNRSIVRVSSLDGTVGGPGPAGGPNLAADGGLTWGDAPSRYDFAVEDWPCVDFAGPTVATHLFHAGGRLRVWKLVRLTQPNRLRAECSGIYPDGWSGAGDSAYFRFGGPAGWLRIVYSRRDWSGRSGPSPVHFLLGSLVIDPNAQPILGHVTRQATSTIDSRQTKVEWLRVPRGRFAVHVVVDRKFVPAEFDRSSGDVRLLGAQVSYRFYRTRP
jgi:hypothetical protein